MTPDEAAAEVIRTHELRGSQHDPHCGRCQHAWPCPSVVLAQAWKRHDDDRIHLQTRAIPGAIVTIDLIDREEWDD